MKLIAATLIAAALAAPALAADSPGMALARKSNCLSCHAVDKKIVGPAYQDVAKKYAGQKDAEAKLVAKVKAGGKGNWGEIPMPPNSAVKDDDIKTLVKWVLAGAK
ncbi:MAG TPA: c-type cytochrome [Rhodocyclaceae bacterium]